MRFTITIDDGDHEKLTSRWRETGATVAEQVRRGIRMWLGTAPLAWKGSVDLTRYEPGSVVDSSQMQKKSLGPVEELDQEGKPEPKKKSFVADGDPSEYIQDDDPPEDPTYDRTFGEEIAAPRPPKSKKGMSAKVREALDGR